MIVRSVWRVPMKLSEWQPEKTNLVRDGSFSSLGTVFTHNPGQIIWIVRERDIVKIQSTPAVSCVITTNALAGKIPDTIGVLSSDDPRSAFNSLQARLSQIPAFVLPPFANRIADSAKIHPSAHIAANSVEIGENVVIEKNVVIHEQTVIDEGSIVRPNSIIGGNPPGQCIEGNSLITCPAGGVHLGREVDIHANTCIQRALFKGYTEIGRQSKIDNLDTIGQGTRIGERCLICAGVAIGESVSIGDDGWIGPNVTLNDQISIGKNVYITIGSTVTQDIYDDKVVKDNYSLDRKRFRKVIRGM
jgi:UDP-3-O-[3-hydroxymyristoyl] glucosamine N-acyltransferase